MPGIVVFKRRWSVGSDDLVVPAVFLVTLHIVWVIVLGVTLGVVEFDPLIECAVHLREHVLGYLVILSGCVLLEAAIACLAMRGTILETTPRTGMQYLLYVRLGILVVEIVWLVLGVIWVSQHYSSCTAIMAKRAILGIIVCNWLFLLSVLVSLWCTFDTAGRSWVKMKRYQESLKEREGRPGHKRRSGSRRRNWRQRRSHSTLSVERVTRKALRAYEESWDRRCGTLFCCVKEDRHRSSFTEVAKLFTEFFRDLDVVPSDIVAGLVLLRKHQKMRRKYIVAQGTNEVYQFLSGVPITPTTKFLSLKNPDVLSEYNKVVHYMRYALGAYGWPMYMMMNAGTGLCKIMPHLRCCRCCCCCCGQSQSQPQVSDNCCECNYAAMKKLSGLKDMDMIYCTYHVDIGETPFFVALDHAEKKVVISIRGTLSLQDVLTDLKADAEQLPIDPVKEDWLGHKGMVQAAVYIKKKIKDEMLLSRAFSRDTDLGTQLYELVLVGHSLGAGTAAILAILLHQEYPNLHCYAYSPPGGLLSATCVEETKYFITSVVVGKDVVPRIGLHQLESLRQELINVIKQSNQPKWRIITGSMMCCCGGNREDEIRLSENDPHYMETFEQMKQEKESRYFTHPSDDQISLTTHTPLFLPGKIIHVVRNHPKDSSRLCGKEEPVYQAVQAENMDFDEVLISPTMINDHMPDNVLEALEKVLTKVSPAKPTRKYSEAERRAMLSDAEPSLDPTDLPEEPLIENAQLEQGWCIEDEPLENATSVPSLRSPPTAVSARHIKALSYPAPRGRPTRLELLARDEWGGHAPLATPETLSETSSVESVSSHGSSRKFGRNSYQKLTSTVPRLQPIQQSPLRQTRSDGYCYFLQQPSPVEYPDSPQKDFGILSEAGIRAANSDETLPSVETTYPRSSSVTESSAHKPPAQLIIVSETDPPYVKHSPESPESGSQLIPEYNSLDIGYHAGGRGYCHGGHLPGIVELSPEVSQELSLTDHGMAECSFLDSTHQDTDNLLSSMEELPTDQPPEHTTVQINEYNGAEMPQEGVQTYEDNPCSSPLESVGHSDTDPLLLVQCHRQAKSNSESREMIEKQDNVQCNAEPSLCKPRFPKEYLDRDVLSQDSTDQDRTCSSFEMNLDSEPLIENSDFVGPKQEKKEFAADLQADFIHSQMVLSEETAEDDKNIENEIDLLHCLEPTANQNVAMPVLHINEEPSDTQDTCEIAFQDDCQQNDIHEDEDPYEVNLMNHLEPDSLENEISNHEFGILMDNATEMESSSSRNSGEMNFLPAENEQTQVKDPLTQQVSISSTEAYMVQMFNTPLISFDSQTDLQDPRTNNLMANSVNSEQDDPYEVDLMNNLEPEPCPEVSSQEPEPCPEVSSQETEPCPEVLSQEPEAYPEVLSEEPDPYEIDLMNSLEPLAAGDRSSYGSFANDHETQFENGIFNNLSCLGFSEDKTEPESTLSVVADNYSQSPVSLKELSEKAYRDNSEPLLCDSLDSLEGKTVDSQSKSNNLDNANDLSHSILHKNDSVSDVHEDIKHKDLSNSGYVSPCKHNVLNLSPVHYQSTTDRPEHNVPLSPMSQNHSEDSIYSSDNINQNCSGSSYDNQNSSDSQSPKSVLSVGEQFLQELVATSTLPLQESEV